ncbi:MAG: XrtB/PEP-CTERM-associated polysaccharide biosynthesis outer membrane protein EpsL [Ignavibacteria bacterium]
MDSKLHGLSRRGAGGAGCAALAATLLLGAASPAWAFFDDRLQVIAGETVTHDSNVFRLSQSADPNAVLGSPQRGDTWYDTTLGFRVDAPISRQRIQAGMSWSALRYDHFKSLNHTDRNGNVNWLWQAGNQWSGLLGYNETHTIASFTNFTGPTPNPLTTKTLSATANFLIDPHWELQAIGSEMRQRNGLAARQANDIDLTSVQVGANYISTASNRIGVNVRQDDGRHPNLESVGAFQVNNNYVQRSMGAMTDWTVTAKSHVAARVDYLRRDYDQFSNRDFSGVTFHAGYDWLATAKTSVSLIALREISASEDVQTGFVVVRGIALTPSYAFSEKLRATASLSSNIRDYKGDPGLATPTSFAGRVDHVHAASLSLTYQPMRTLTLLLSGQRETRSSNQPLLDYVSNLVEISARLAF